MLGGGGGRGYIGHLEEVARGRSRINWETLDGN